MSQFLNYNETYEILHDRLKAQHVEIEYWTRNIFSTFISNEIIHLSKLDSNTNMLEDILFPFISDIPNNDKTYKTPCSNFDPTLCFYWKQNVMNFSPPPHDRLVLIRDLPTRMWPRHSRSELNTFSDFPALEKAAQEGMLRFYDKENCKFTYYKRSKGSCRDKLWYYTAEGEKYLSGDRDEFFLLQDIINIERIFFNRPRNECLKELGFNPEDEDFK